MTGILSLTTFTPLVGVAAATVVVGLVSWAIRLVLG